MGGHISVLGRGTNVAIAAGFGPRAGLVRKLLIAAFFVGGVLPIPRQSDAGMIFMTDEGVGSFAPQETTPGDEPQQFPEEADLLAVSNGTGDAETIPPQPEIQVASAGIIIDSPDLDPWQISERMLTSPTLFPLDPLPDGLLDPPKRSK